ncbi:hypothetical protein I4U23_024372 [Adineta vaga]|nr:hypothetical protein I4U23_024372 [Adineta vaga]
MFINIQRYLFGLLFTIMLIISAFHGSTDARRVRHRGLQPNRPFNKHHGYSGTHGHTSKHRYHG